MKLNQSKSTSLLLFLVHFLSGLLHCAHPPPPPVLFIKKKKKDWQRLSRIFSLSNAKMTCRETSEDIMEKVFAAILESCCNVLIIPLCEDSIRRLDDRLKSEQKRIMRGTDLSKREVFIWMKKVGNLKKRSEIFLATHENRVGFCRFLSFPFDNYIAATLLQNWEKVDEEEPSEPLPPDSTGAQLSRKSTAPIGSIEAELSHYQLNGNDVSGGDERDQNDRNYASDNFLVLDSLGFIGEGDQVARDLLSTLKMAAGHSGASLVQSTHDIRLIRSKSFEIIHNERWIVFDRRIL